MTPCDGARFVRNLPGDPGVREAVSNGDAGILASAASNCASNEAPNVRYHELKGGTWMLVTVC
jgi:hypothetical protein